MNWLNKKTRNEIGSVSIEGAIALTAFLFMFIMIYSIITLSRAQSKIQIGLDATAKELSQYSYLYGLTGFYDSIGRVQKSGQDTKNDVNETIGLVSNTFESIQSLKATGESVVESSQTINIGNIDSVMNEWDAISTEIKDSVNSVKDDATALKEKISSMAEDPQKLLFGMAKLIGSEALELTKSKLIAEPIARVLIKKHLKRNNSDTAEAFCQYVGIVPESYLGNVSSFNGIDFSNSTLFPYGINEISIVATYKVKMLQLLPIDFVFKITQSSVTRGWLPGEYEFDKKEKIIEYYKNKSGAIWNYGTYKELEDLMRSMGLKDLKDNGYFGVKGDNMGGQNIVQAYNPSTNSFSRIVPLNPLYGIDSIDKIDREEIKETLRRYAGAMKSNTDNIKKIRISDKDANGNIITREVEIDGKMPKDLRVVLVIPEDSGLQEIIQEIVDELGSDVNFDINPGYGSVYEEDNGGNKEDETSNDGGGN